MIGLIPLTNTLRVPIAELCNRTIWVSTVPKGSLEIKGKELKTFEGKGGSGQSQNYFHRTFCGSCGSSVYAAIETPPDLLFVHAGTLDDTTWVKPDVQAWTGRQLPCVNVPDGNKFDGNLPTE